MSKNSGIGFGRDEQGKLILINPAIGGWIDMIAPPRFGDDGGFTIAQWDDASDAPPRAPEPTQEPEQADPTDEDAANCPYDPTLLAGQPIGMHHCPLCGSMVIGGMPHPKEWN